MTTAHPFLQAAIGAAREAAAIIRTAAADPAALQVRAKQPKDFVTQVDLASQQAIEAALLTAFPDHALRSEESPHTLGAANASHVWIVDPLDGTTNFIHGYPVYAVSIALAIEGRLEHGVVIDVARGDLFHASRGAGSFCNGQRLQVSCRGLDDAVVATSCPPHAGPGFEVSLQMLGAVMARARAIRRSGSAALDLAWVAAGHCDAQFDLGLNAWDVAAGSLLVREAGGEVTGFHGEADCLERRECIAAHPALRAALGTILAPFAPQSQPTPPHDPSNRHAR